MLGTIVAFVILTLMCFDDAFCDGVNIYDLMGYKSD